MTRRKRIGMYLVVLLLFLCLLSACGKEEVYQPELGIDGCVYPAKRMLAVDMLVGNLKVAGDYLYYARNGEKGMEISRLPVSSIRTGEEAEESSKAEVLYRVRSRRTEIPDYIMEQLSARALPGDEEGQSVWVETGDGDRVDISKTHCLFSFRNFDVDREGNVYCWQDVMVGKDLELKSIGGTLSKWDSIGETEYQIYYFDMLGFEPCEDGGACILGEGRIVFVDREGVQTGEVSTEQYRGNGQPLCERLLKDMDGHIYYLLRNQSGIEWGFEILWEDGVQLKEMGGKFCDAVVNERSFASSARKIFTGGYGDFLYEYNTEDDSERKVLNWTESGLLAIDIRSVARISQDKLVVYYGYGSDEGLYLLTRTSVEELPEKETIVLFSYDPTDELKDAVMQFNRENDTYQIIMDRYGAEYSWWTREGDAPLVDLAVVSQTPPDILDMTFLDLHKYADKGVLEDLTPYLEDSTVLDREEFLENALEGLTLDGCLTCIPNSFEAQWLMGRESQLGDLERWSMKEVYGLLEKYPKSEHKLISGIYGNIEERDYLLNKFCSYYCLEKFVDLEKRESSFENEEFVKLLKFIGDNYGTERNKNVSIPCIVEDALLVNWSWNGFGEMAEAEAYCRDQTALLGYPSVDGKGVYPVYIYDALAITVNSSHKKGAWEFIEYFLSSEKSRPSLFFPTRKEWIEEAVEKEVHPNYYEDEEKGIRYYANVNGDEVPVYAVSQEQADSMLEAIESADFTPRTQKEKMILRIISEEAESYYNGDKSMEEVVRIIQSRVNLLLQEG